MIDAGRLYVVGTPIGNVEDMTLRAVRILKEVHVIAAEDTRHTGMLLQRLEIRGKKLISYHHFNEASRQEEFFERFANGENIALVSDAGMPGISDPGERLIRNCVQRGVKVEVIPGPSAVLHALVASGLKPVPFYFGGFLPVKSGARKKELFAASERDCTSVYFESPHRLAKTLADCVELFPEKICCVARELTKKFEEVFTASARDLQQHFPPQKIRGEITFLVTGKEI